MKRSRLTLGLPLAAFVLSVHGAAGWALSVAMEPHPQVRAGSGSLTVFVLGDGSGEGQRVSREAGLLSPQVGDWDVPAVPVPFHASAEVDQSARPVNTWTMDAEDLAALGVQRIEFEVWVDEQAHVAALQVLSVEPPDLASLSPLLEERLRQTAMVAARKDGKPVAHRQLIELGLARGGEPTA